MATDIHKGDCVKIPDGRIGRVREKHGDSYKIRVKRKTSDTHQFINYKANALEKVDCPKGWMSPEGYNRYLAKTLAKMHERQKKKK
jgi:hypothetical protein